MEDSFLSKIISKSRFNGRSVVAFSSLADSMQVNITNGKHMWMSDEPVNYQGNDLGPNPVELLMASLAACSVVTILKKAKEVGITISSLAVSCGYTRILDSNNPNGLDSPQRIRLVKSIMLPDISDEALLIQIKSFADNCPVESIITGEFQINTEFSKLI
jgi:putative redox protein